VDGWFPETQDVMTSGALSRTPCYCAAIARVENERHRHRTSENDCGVDRSSSQRGRAENASSSVTREVYPVVLVLFLESERLTKKHRRNVPREMHVFESDGVGTNPQLPHKCGKPRLDPDVAP
jgi:hypothetical protein